MQRLHWFLHCLFPCGAFVSSRGRGLKYQQIDFLSSTLAEPNLIQASTLIVRGGYFRRLAWRLLQASLSLFFIQIFVLIGTNITPLCLLSELFGGFRHKEGLLTCTGRFMWSVQRHKYPHLSVVGWVERSNLELFIKTSGLSKALSQLDIFLFYKVAHKPLGWKFEECHLLTSL